MKKHLILGVLFVMLLLAGCANKDNDESDKSDDNNDEIEKRDLPTKVFDNKTTNSQLSEEEIKESIKLYLNKDDDLNKAKEYYQDKVDSEENLSKKETKEIKQLNKLIRDNDSNFHNYISKNTLPKEYNKYAFKISEYISTSNKEFQNLD